MFLSMPNAMLVGAFALCDKRLVKITQGFSYKG